MNVCDGTLVLGVLNGDRSAFAELYDRRARLIRAICYDETGDPHLAADLTQEVFLRAFKNLRRLHAPEKFAAWLVGIARQVCRESRRRRGREDRAMVGLTDQWRQADQVANPPDELLLELRDAIARPMMQAAGAESLTRQERLALHAFYLQGQNAEEARGVLGLSRSGFYRVLSSACDRLRRMLEGHMHSAVRNARKDVDSFGDVQR